jgi:hypothetical protein
MVTARGGESPMPQNSIRFTINTLDDDSSKEAFLAIAPQHKDDPKIAELLSPMGGLPLAIELMARRARDQQNLDVLVQQWQKFDTAMLRRAVPGRQTSLNHSLELSYSSPRLTPDAHKLLAILAFLPRRLAHQRYFRYFALYNG